METQAKSTATPWKVMDGAILGEMVNEYGNFIVVECRRDRTDQDEANLALICRAVNAHDDLVEAVNMAIGYVETTDRKNPILETFRTALAKAEGRS